MIEDISFSFTLHARTISSLYFCLSVLKKTWYLSNKENNKPRLDLCQNQKLHSQGPTEIGFSGPEVFMLKDISSHIQDIQER